MTANHEQLGSRCKAHIDQATRTAHSCRSHKSIFSAARPLEPAIRCQGKKCSLREVRATGQTRPFLTPQFAENPRNYRWKIR